MLLLVVQKEAFFCCKSFIQLRKNCNGVSLKFASCYAEKVDMFDPFLKPLFFPKIKVSTSTRTFVWTQQYQACFSDESGLFWHLSLKLRSFCHHCIATSIYNSTFRDRHSLPKHSSKVSHAAAKLKKRSYITDKLNFDILMRSELYRTSNIN